MRYNNLETEIPIYQSNMRAEDGLPKNSAWNSFCEGVLIPLGSLFAVFLAMLSLMLLID